MTIRQVNKVDIEQTRYRRQLHEDIIFSLVRSGEIKIDDEGRIWHERTKWKGYVRAEYKRNHPNPTVYIERLKRGRKITALAMRLIWRAKFGPIPDGMSVVPLNGKNEDTRPENLTLRSNS